jgi:hypothetical protein
MNATAPSDPAPAKRPAQWLVGLLVLVVVVAMPAVLLADQQVQYEAVVCLLVVGVIVCAVVLIDGIVQLARWWRTEPRAALRAAAVGGYVLGVACLAFAFLLADRFVLGGDAPALLAAVLLEALAIGGALVLRQLCSPRIDEQQPAAP